VGEPEGSVLLDLEEYIRYKTCDQFAQKGMDFYDALI